MKRIQYLRETLLICQTSSFKIEHEMGVCVCLKKKKSILNSAKKNLFFF